MEQCIRVLHVLGGLDRGGAETMVMNLYRNIDRRKIQFDFVVNELQPGFKYQYYKEVIELGGSVYFAPKFSVRNLLRYREWWNDFFNEHSKYTAIHGHHTAPGFIYLPTAKKHGIIVIAHSHIAGRENTAKSFAKRVLRYPLRYIADYRFACSKLAAKWMYGTEKDVIILNNAIDSEKFRFNAEVRKNLRKELCISREEVLLGNVGRLTTQKNHSFLLEVFASYHFKNPKSKLLLIGDGEDREKIRKEVQKLGVEEYVILTGVRNDIHRLLQAMDLFVFPSLYEGLPVTVVEAQAAGLPCLISDTVTTEVKISDPVIFLPITQGTDIWTNEIEIMQKKNYNREAGADRIKMAKYDIRDTAEWLTDFYKSL